MPKEKASIWDGLGDILLGSPADSVASREVSGAAQSEEEQGRRNTKDTTRGREADKVEAALMELKGGGPGGWRPSGCWGGLPQGSYREHCPPHLCQDSSTHPPRGFP